MSEANTSHIVSVSGGKDSTAVYLLAIEWSQRNGFPFRAVFADTGNELPPTYDYIRELPTKAGGPEVEWVKADFTKDFARKRAFIAKNWEAAGVPADRVARAIELLQPTGNPFLDLCMWKGRFPSTRARFCTDHLKRDPIMTRVVMPLMDQHRSVWSWQGVRREEGKTVGHPRRLLPRTEYVGGDYWITRPIIEWKVAQVFDQHRRHGVAPNPLYRQGMGRVGCVCIHAAKEELARIALLYPEQVDRLEEWERLVGEVSKRGQTTFFSADKTPGDHQGRTDVPMPGIREVVEWSKTSRGGAGLRPADPRRRGGRHVLPLVLRPLRVRAAT